MTEDINPTPDAPIVPAEVPVVLEYSDVISSLPTELRDSEFVKESGSLEALVKRAVDTKKSIGDMVRIPTEDASEQTWTDFYGKLENIEGVVRLPSDEQSTAAFQKRLGVPESAEGYDFELGETVSTEDANKVREVSHKLGLTKDQATAYADIIKGGVEEYQNTFQEMQDKTVSTLKGKWGSDFDARIKGAGDFVDSFRGEYGNLVDEFKGSPLMNNAVVLEILSSMNAHTKEGNVVSPNTSSKAYGMTPEQADTQITDMMNNKDHPIHKPTHPQHTAAKQKYNSLVNVSVSGSDEGTFR